MNAGDNSIQHNSPIATAQVPTSTTATATSLNTQEDMQVSDAPYTAAQPTPAASTKAASTLPPIAMAQPLNGSNNPNGPSIYQNGINSPNPNHVVMVTSVDPVGSFGDAAESDNMRFAFLQKCRLMAGCLMVYYAATFLFLQPFFLGTLGLLTGFMGFHGSRAPVDAMRFKWLRYYMWANYVMMILNLWLLIVTLVFSGSIFGFSDNRRSDSDHGESTYYTSSTGIYIGLLVAANTLMHLRCLRTVQQLVAELANAGIDQPAPVVVLAAANQTSAV